MNWAIIGGTVGGIVGTLLVVFTKNKKNSNFDMNPIFGTKKRSFYYKTSY